MELEGHEAKTEGHLRQAERLARELADDFPDEADYRVEQFRATYQLGQWLWASGRLEEAARPLRRASSLAARLVADHPDVPAGHYFGGMRIAPSSRTVSPLK